MNAYATEIPCIGDSKVVVAGVAPPHLHLTLQSLCIVVASHSACPRLYLSLSLSLSLSLALLSFFYHVRLARSKIAHQHACQWGFWANSPVYKVIVLAPEHQPPLLIG